MLFRSEIKQVKKEMSVLSEIISKGIILRSKEQEIEEGEKCTRYFFKKILTRGGKIIKLKEEDREGNNNKEILNMGEEFYRNLYGEKDVHKGTMDEVLNFVEKKVNSHDVLTDDFTVLESQKCLKGFKKGKSPGEDGLPAEFYDTFWDILSNDILTVFREFERLDRLPDSFRIGIVSLLYKKGDRTDIRNWRPITLLNLDCKLFSSFIKTNVDSFRGRDPPGSNLRRSWKEDHGQIGRAHV